MLNFMHKSELKNAAYYAHVHLSLLSYNLSSRGGLEVERLLHNLHDSVSVGSNPARRQKDFRSN